MVKSDEKISIKSTELLKTLKNLKKDFEFPMGITATHFPPKIELNYKMISLKHPYIATVITKIPDTDPKIETSIEIFGGNKAHELEIYDLLGVKFEGHKNLKRILLPEGFEGHPLRKDYK